MISAGALPDYPIFISAKQSLWHQSLLENLNKYTGLIYNVLHMGLPE